MLFSAKHAMSMLFFLIALHVSSGMWLVVDSSKPLTFLNRMRMESFVLFMRVCPNGLLVNLFLLVCCVSGIGVVGIIGVMVAGKIGEWYVIVDVSVSLLVLC